MNLFLWNFRTKCCLLRKCQVPPDLSEQLTAQHAENSALPCGLRWLRCCLSPTPTCFGTSPRGAAASVQFKNFTPCFLGLSKKWKDSTGKANAWETFAATSFGGCSLEFLVAFFFSYKGTIYGTCVKPFDRTVLKSRSGKWHAVTRDWLWGRLEFWNESQRSFYLLAHRLHYWK